MRELTTATDRRLWDSARPPGNPHIQARGRGLRARAEGRDGAGPRPGPPGAGRRVRGENNSSVAAGDRPEVSVRRFPPRERVFQHSPFRAATTFVLLPDEGRLVRGACDSGRYEDRHGLRRTPQRRHQHPSRRNKRRMAAVYLPPNLRDAPISAHAYQAECPVAICSDELPRLPVRHG
jgi:hypothetical protein